MTGMNFHRSYQGSWQRGFSLIEVLIALIIMSVGMLGIAGLYVHGMQAGRTSLFRHHAVTLAGDVADRIRANPGGAVAYVDVANPSAVPGTNCVAGGVDCTPGEMAAQDKFLWDQQANQTLPNGDVTVGYSNAAVPSLYTVTITWNEAGANPAPQYQITFPVFEM